MHTIRYIRALNWNPDKVMFAQSDEELENPGVYTSIFTGRVAKHILRVIEQMNIKEAKERYTSNNDESMQFKGYPLLHVPLFIAITQDDAELHSKSKRSACPILMDILNIPRSEDDVGGGGGGGGGGGTGAGAGAGGGLKDEDDIYVDMKDYNDFFLLGFQPEFPHETARLKSYLKTIGLKHEGVKAKRIRRAHRYVRFKTMDEVTKPLRAVQKSGFKLQIGRGEKAILVIAHPVIVLIPGDNKEQQDQSSVSSQCNGMKCRSCDETNCCRFTRGSQTWRYRDDKRMKSLVTDMSKIEKKISNDLISRKSARVNKDLLTEIEKEVVTTTKKCNLIPCESTVYFDIVEETREIWGFPDWFGLHCYFPPDELHTLLKGPVENTLAWSMDIFYMLQRLNHNKYGNIINAIDNGFRDFNYSQTATPVPLIAKKEGLSKIWTESRSAKTAANAGTGFGCGGTPAAHLPGMAFTLLYVIGENGGHVVNSIIPEKLVVSESKRQYHRNITVKGPQKDWKIKTIIVNALQSVLDVVTYSRKSEGFSEEDLNNLDDLIRNMRGHQAQLFALKSDLKQLKKGISISARKHKVFTGIKQHLLEHITDAIRNFGIKRKWDTQCSERYHIKVKAIYKRTSQRKATAFKEVGVRMANITRIQFLQIALRQEEKLQPLQDEIAILQHRLHIIEQTYHALTQEVEAKEAQQKREHLQQQQQRRQRHHIPRGENVSCVELNDELEKSPESLFSSFFIPTNTKKESMVVKVDSIIRPNPEDRSTTIGEFVPKRDVGLHIHPFLGTKQMFHYLNAKTPEGRSRDMFDKHLANPESVTIKVNGMLSSKGKREFGIPPFTIHCNRTKDAFSAIEINLAENDGIQVLPVRVFAIVTLEENKDMDNTTQSRTVLLCCLLKKDTTRKNWDASPVFKYDRVNGMLDYVVIDLTSVVRPACLIPEKTSRFPATFREEYNQQERDSQNPKHRRFFHVKIPTMHYIKVIEWIAEQMVIRHARNEPGYDIGVMRGGESKGEASYNSMARKFVCHSLYFTLNELEAAQTSCLGGRQVGQESDWDAYWRDERFLEQMMEEDEGNNDMDENLSSDDGNDNELDEGSDND